METQRTTTAQSTERQSGWIHPLDRRRAWSPSERDDALADLNAHLERTSAAPAASRLRSDYRRSI